MGLENDQQGWHPLYSQKVWGISYFALIPIFAFIYYLLPSHSFFHSTSMYEPVTQEIRERVALGIKTALLERIIETNGSEIVRHNIWELDASKLRLVGLDIRDDSHIAFQLHGYSELIEKDWSNLPKDLIPVSIWYLDCEFKIAGDSWTGGKPTIRRVFTTPRDLNMIPTRIVFPLDAYLSDDPDTFVREMVPSEPFHFSIPSDLFNLIVGWNNALNGLAGDAPGNGWRMFYLSMITITTLGYGDIVPLTDFARILVGSQAVLGILFIGLFLNALSQKRKQRMNDSLFEAPPEGINVRKVIDDPEQSTYFVTVKHIKKERE